MPRARVIAPRAAAERDSNRARSRTARRVPTGKRPASRATARSTGALARSTATGRAIDAGDEEDRRHRFGVGVDAGADREDAVGEEGHGGGEGAVDPAWHRRSGGDGVGDRHPGDGSGRPPRRDGGGGHGEPDAGDRQPERDVPGVDAVGGGRLEGRRRCQPGEQAGAGAGDGGGEADGGAVGDHGPAEVARGGAGGGEQAELAHAAVGEGGEARPGHEAHEDHGDGGDDEHGDGGGGLLGRLPRLDEALTRRDAGPEAIGLLAVGVDEQGDRLGRLAGGQHEGVLVVEVGGVLDDARRPRSGCGRRRPGRRARRRGRRRHPR